MNVSHLDHLVLTVKNVEKTVEFYQQVLGMDKVVFADDRVCLRYGQQKINLHQLGHEFEPKAKNVKPGSADLCFIIHTPLEEAVAHLCESGVEVIEGPVERTGAIGTIMSVYFRDPDGNLIEISNNIK